MRMTRARNRVRTVKRNLYPNFPGAGFHANARSSAGNHTGFYASAPLINLSKLQAKLTVGRANDAYEREADTVADHVANGRRVPPITPLSGAQPKQQAKLRTLLVQRVCTECEKEKLQRQAREDEQETIQTAGKQGAGPVVSPSVESGINGLRSGGQPLEPATRGHMESHFGQDFSQVRIHTGGGAADTARSLNARAFTLGNHVVMGAGEDQPNSTSGERLLSHELTHVVQQKGLPPHSIQTIQRRMVVEDPTAPLPGAPARESWQDVRDYFRVLAPAFSVSPSGAISPSPAALCSAIPPRFTDRCLCDLHNSSNPVPWKIKIDDNQWPHTEEANRRVTVQSTRSGVELGAWGGGAAAGRRITQPMPRVLGHELCGHAWLMEMRIHPPFLAHRRRGRLMGRPSHDVTVMIENRVAEDIFGPGVARRGTFSDPHHGESFALITVSGYRSGYASAYSLPPVMQARLDRVRRFMVSEPLLKADVIGHADHPGSASVNRRISRRRAQSVRRWLVRRGIRGGRFISVIGKSNSECPPVPRVNPDCRKVDIYLFIFEGASERNP